MERTISTTGYAIYPRTESTASAQTDPQAQAQQEPSSGDSGGWLQEYGGLAKKAFNPASTSIAEGYNTVYDAVTGWDAAAVPGTNLATGTTSSGTFGGGNFTNAAYGYAGGKLANELFDNKGYSDIGGTLGASLGASAAVGGSAAGAALSSMGWAAGPIGALAGAALGAAIGSMFGGDAEDYRFRTYSGDMGGYSDLNKNQMAEQASDWQSINAGQGEAYDRWKGGDYSDNTASAYKWLKEGNTFAIGDASQLYKPGGEGFDKFGKFGKMVEANLKPTATSDTSRAYVDQDYASIDGPFGKYTVGHIDDIPDKDPSMLKQLLNKEFHGDSGSQREEFAQGWVDAVGKLDAAVASILTPEQIAKSKAGLAGSIQGTQDWNNTMGQNYATDAMIADRYTAIFELAGRDDLAQQLSTAMDRSKSAVAENGLARAIPALTELLKAESNAGSAASTGVQAGGNSRGTSGGTSRNTRRSRPSRQPISISRPAPTINPAMELNYV